MLLARTGSQGRRDSLTLKAGELSHPTGKTPATPQDLREKQIKSAPLPQPRVQTVGPQPASSGLVAWPRRSSLDCEGPGWGDPVERRPEEGGCPGFLSNHKDAQIPHSCKKSPQSPMGPSMRERLPGASRTGCLNSTGEPSLLAACWVLRAKETAWVSALEIWPHTALQTAAAP